MAEQHHPNGEKSGSSQKRRLEGVFSNQEVRMIGTGTTTRKAIQKFYWFALEQENGEIELQPLNSNYVPSGPKKRISKNEFLEQYAPEPEFYVTKVFPKIKEVNKIIARADRHRQNNELFSAEMEYGNALNIDEDNIRANFGLGITYLERGENNKAEDILGRLVRLEGAFETEHKHLFNDFGINLRKNGMYDQSIAYYARALELTNHDENLYYNIARAHLEKKDPAAAVDYLLKGMEINPRQETLLKFLMWLLTNDLVPESKKPAAAAMLQRAKSAREAGENREKQPGNGTEYPSAGTAPAGEAPASKEDAP